MLPWGSKTPLPSYTSPLCSTSLFLTSLSEGLRLCFVRYEDEALERGRSGRLVDDTGESGERCCCCPLMYD
jgi:hypothetical protein